MDVTKNMHGFFARVKWNEKRMLVRLNDSCNHAFCTLFGRIATTATADVATTAAK